MRLGPRRDGTAGVRLRAAALWVGLLAAAAAAFPATPLPAQAPPDVQAVAERAIRRLDLQRELPRTPESSSFRLTLPDEVLWLVVAVGIAVILYAFRDMIPILGIGRRGAWGKDEGGAAESGPRAPAAVLGAADEIAAQGRFVEAMHVLLLQALAAIRRRLDEQLADSMTSREILRSKELSDDLRRPLRDMVARVEWTYFGEHPAAREDYLACRASFSALTAALQGSAAA